MGRYCHCVVFIVAVSVLPACGHTNKYLALHHKPLESPVEVLKEEHLLRVEVVDTRKDKEVVGKWCGDRRFFLVRDSVADLVKGALSAEFVRRGYALGGGGVAVKINLQEFFYFSCGSSPLVSHTREAYIGFEVQVCGRDGICIYSGMAHGGDSHPSVWSEVSAEDTLEDALSNSIARLFDDQSFRGAILKASRN